MKQNSADRAILKSFTRQFEYDFEISKTKNPRSKSNCVGIKSYNMKQASAFIWDPSLIKQSV